MSVGIEALYVKTFRGSVALPDDTFRQIVRTECRRADRSGLACSAVRFHVDRHELSPLAARRVVRMLNRRIRRTDLVGWWDDESLCVLLADTDLAGASEFVSEAGTMLRGVCPSIHHSLYSYPERWFDDESPVAASARSQDARAFPQLGETEAPGTAVSAEKRAQEYAAGE